MPSGGAEDHGHRARRQCDRSRRQGSEKVELQRIIRAYLSLESENPQHTVYFNRSPEGNGIFSKIDTSERQSVPKIIQQLVHCNEYEPSLHKFFVDLSSYLKEGKFNDDYSTIAMEAPELKEKFIHQAFVHVGESVSQKKHRIWTQEGT